jgi:hypothetical protein
LFLGEKDVEFTEGAVDAFCGLEGVRVGEEGFGAVAVVALLLGEVVGVAEAGARVFAGQAAASSGWVRWSQRSGLEAGRALAVVGSIVICGMGKVTGCVHFMSLSFGGETAK